MGNAFVHIELNTEDVDKAKKFYGKLFDWKIKPWGDGYQGIEVGQGTGGGMMKKPMPEAPTMWLPYVEVDDVKKTIAKARKLGADIKVEYMPIGDMGAIGVFVDPTGAGLGLWETAKKKDKKKEKKTPKKK
jgi:predicted enzyme related to lactoylglutathione lyase